jgi:tetratricopeptide (TPR) repeat protein
MTKPQRRGAPPPASMANLPARAAEALQRERFKEAIELFKTLARQDPQPRWKEALADAYCGRARDLSDKGMFKEAAMVLENTLTPSGMLRDPRLYVTCLIRDGQQAKAAAYLLKTIGHPDLPASERAALEGLTAALLLTVPQLPASSPPVPPEVARWRDAALAAREALAAWVDGASAEEMERHLNRISLRSAFRPVRLLLKSVMTFPPDPARTLGLLETIDRQSPFFPLRTAVEAALRAGSGLDADAWQRLTPAQQAFVAETGGLPAESVQSLTRMSAAAQSGPSALFTYLLKQSNLPEAELRSACLNLLPKVPDRIAQFEQRFGPLSRLDQYRVQALAAEARGDWPRVEDSWYLAARLTAAAEDRPSQLSSGVIYRHLAHLATQNGGFTGGPDPQDDPRIFYLERSADADPDHIPTILARMAWYRREERHKDWHRLADEAVQRFPQDSQILLQATQSAVARQAYKKAAGFARRLLTIDPINPGVRRQMIELQLAHARKQMRAKRADLAARELAQAAEWDRADAPNGLLRIARGLVALQGGEKEQAAAWLREGAALAGGGVDGWFRAVLEAELMQCAGGDALWLREELVGARRAPPTKAAVMAITSALGQVPVGDSKRGVASLVLAMRAWLSQAAGIVWSAAEFQILADVFVRFEAFDVLRDYARAARRREPGHWEWRFYEIVARTRGDSRRMTMAESDAIDDMGDAASERGDTQAVKRLARFIGMEQPRLPHRGRVREHDLDEDGKVELLELLKLALKDMPKGATDGLRGRVREIGREAAIAELLAMTRGSEMGAAMPLPMLREFCEDMVDNAMSGHTARKGRA